MTETKQNGKGDKRRPELVMGSYIKNYVKIFRDSKIKIEEEKVKVKNVSY